MKTILRSILFLLAFAACSTDEEIVDVPPSVDPSYFPPLDSNEWASTDPDELGWNTLALEDLLTYLRINNTRAFIILKDGKIAVEAYFGNTILGTAPFDQNSLWYWASAGKTLTATLVGIAQQDGSLNIENPTSDYLGVGWTSLHPEKEQLITVKNQLSMTTGLDYDIPDLDCTLPACFSYQADPGTQWFYHNGAYTILKNVVENATNMDYQEFTNQKLASKIGMNGIWRSQGYHNVYWSNARDMARFGLLILNQGDWDGTEVLSDKNYYRQMIHTSQDLNPSYGYLWWLNGKDKIIFPSLATSFDGSLSENAPVDLLAGMGKNGQFVEVIPSKNLVVIRMGESPDSALVPIVFHDEMWKKISLVIHK